MSDPPSPSASDSAEATEQRDGDREDARLLLLRSASDLPRSPSKAQTSPPSSQESRATAFLRCCGRGRWWPMSLTGTSASTTSRSVTVAVTVVRLALLVLALQLVLVMWQQWHVWAITHRIQPIARDADSLVRSHDRQQQRLSADPAARLRWRLQRQRPYANIEGSSPTHLRSPVTLPHNDTALPPHAVATLFSPEQAGAQHNGCHMVYLLYRSLLRYDPVRTLDFLIVYTENLEKETREARAVDDYCRLLDGMAGDTGQQWCINPAATMSDSESAVSEPYARSATTATVERRRCFSQGRVRWTPVPNVHDFVARHRGISIDYANWEYSLNKMHLFGMEQYERLLVLDSDLLLRGPVHSLLRLDADVAAGQDTWSCLHLQLNGGMFSLRPSAWLAELYAGIILAEEQPACISGRLAQSDQEAINCLCGFGGAGYPRRPEVRCQMLPWFVNVMPSYSQCEDYHADDVLAIHYASTQKPWRRLANGLLPQKCTEERVASAATELQPDQWFNHDEHRECFKGEQALQTYFYCVEWHEQRMIEAARASAPSQRSVDLAAIPHHQCRLFMP